jgi:polygalacturonase
MLQKLFRLQSIAAKYVLSPQYLAGWTGFSGENALKSASENRVVNRTCTPLLSGAGLLALMLLALSVVPAARAQPAGADDWSRAEEIARTIKLPEIPSRDYVITNFGAQAGGTADARPAILAAIKKASADGGGRVVIPAGKWLSRGPIHLASRINLHVAEGATLLFSPEARHYLPVVLTRWEGTEMYGYSPLIYAFEVRDVAITGKGVIDGNGASEFLSWIPKAEPDFQRLRRMGVDGTPAAKRVFGEGTHLRPSIIQFFRAERVLLEDYTVLNSPFWVNHLVYTDHATVRRIRVDSHHANNDGVDVDSSRYVLIENCWFRTGDDSVVVKSGRDRDGREIGRPSEHVVVRNNDMGGEDGIALGSEMSGGIRYVYFTDNVLRKGASAIRFKANLDRGGTVEHIRVRNFTVEAFENLFWFQLDYPGQLGGNFPSTYRDIIFENFTVERAGTVFNGDAPAAAPLRDVTLRNVNIKQADRTFILKNVEGLKLENVVIGGQRVDGRLEWRQSAR